MKGIIATAMNMKMDVYDLVITQDEVTKSIIKKYLYVTTENCLARGYISDSSRSQGSSEKVGERYQNLDYLTIETQYKMSKTQRVTNIRNQKDEVIWFELIKNNYDTTTVYDVQGVTPVLDPFGNIISYNVSVKRSEVQKIEE